MKQLLIICALFISTLKLLAVEPQKKSTPLTETQKIEQLYSYLESLNNVQFFRNGSYYNVTDAIAHLKMKQGKVGSGAKTARLFIDNVATKSSMSGSAYKIKFVDGKEVPLRDVLMTKLLEIEGVSSK